MTELKWWHIYRMAKAAGLKVEVELAHWDDPVC